MLNALHEQQSFSLTDLDTIFTRFSPQDIEEFYQLYQLWSLQHKREQVLAKLNKVEQQITANKALFDTVSPSPIALATLAQFRAVGVDDIDLLDRMLEHGDEWLDHTLQLFEYCERMDMLQGNPTEWCTHALEGAYDWIGSMGNINEQNPSDEDTLLAIPAISANQPVPEITSLPLTTEADFLQKLMSEDEESTELLFAIPHTTSGTQEYHEPTADQTPLLPPTEPDSLPEQQPYNEPTADQTLLPTEPDHLPEQQPYSEPIADQTSHPLPAQPDSLPEQIAPSTQLISALQPAPNTTPKRAIQIRRPLKTSSQKQKGRHKNRHFNQYKRKQKRIR